MSEEGNKIQDNAGKSSNPKNSCKFGNCASQTPKPQKQCLRNQWDYIVAELENRSLEYFISIGVAYWTPTENRRTFILRLLCMGNNNAIANQAWATKLSEIWGLTNFMGEHICSGHTDLLSCVCSQEEAYSCRCSTTLNFGSKNSQQTFLANATEITEYAKQFKLGRWCFFGFGQDNVWHVLARKMTQMFEETSFWKGDLKPKRCGT